MNISYLLTSMADKVPNKAAFVFENVRMSYKELNSRVNRLAHTLLDIGVRKGDKVALMSMNSAYYPEIFFATLRAGGVFVPINFRLSLDEVSYIVNHSDAKVFLFEKELASKIICARSHLPKVEKFICIDADAGEDIQNYENLVKMYPDSAPDVNVSLEDDCELVYTSGTTGRPKGVVLTHENVFSTMLSAIIGRELRLGPIQLVVSPMYHVAGLNNHFGTTVALGGTAIIMRQFDPEAVMKVIQKERIEHFPAASTIFNLLVLAIEGKQYDTSSVVHLQSGSANTPVEVRKKLARLFPSAVGVYEAYGLTEVGDGVVFLTGKDSLARPASIGKAGLFAQLKVVDDNGREVAVGEVGEITIKGPVVMKGYYKNKEETENTIRNSWLYTGDLGKLDDEEYLYIVGRKKDMIISGGENIYPREIEEVLWQHPKIAEVAVIGVPDKKWGESVRAVVQLKSGEGMTVEEVVDFCKKRIASYKKPKSVVFVDEIPKNPSGKTLKNEVKAKYGQ